MNEKDGRTAVLQVVDSGAVFRVETVMGRGLRITARVHQGLDPFANTAEIAVWNLNETSRARVDGKIIKKLHYSAADLELLRQAGVANIPREVTYTNMGIALVTLHAGYGQPPVDVLFDGESQRIRHKWDDQDIETALICADGAVGIREAPLEKSYMPNTPVVDVVVDLFNAMGIAVTPFDQTTILGAFTRAGRTNMTFPYGFNANGRALAQVQQILEYTDIAWTVLNGELVLLSPDMTLPDAPIEISVETGLVGSPVQREDGSWEVVTTLNGRITPGRQITVDSREMKGLFRVVEADHSVDTWGDDDQMTSATVTTIGDLGDL